VYDYIIIFRKLQKYRFKFLILDLVDNTIMVNDTLSPIVGSWAVVLFVQPIGRP
jgi:hypothetical protein